jgi:flagellar biogenesis protein FliO
MTPLRQRILVAALGLCLGLCAFSAHAEEGPDASVKAPSWLAPHSEKPHAAAAAGPSVGLGRSLGVLLLTSVLGGGALYLRSKKGKQPKAKLQQLRVLGMTKLGGRAQLVLAEVAGRKILLGVTDASVNKLGWLESDDEDEAPQIAVRPRVLAGPERAPRIVAPEPTPPPKRSFRDLLASAVGNLGRPDDDSAAVTIAAETRDTFTRSTPRANEPRASEPRRVEPRKAGPQMLDVEGQAKGLLARLGEPRA